MQLPENATIFTIIAKNVNGNTFLFWVITPGLHCRLPRVSHTNGKKATIAILWVNNQDSFTHHFSDHVIELLQSTHNKTATARLAHTSCEKVQPIMEKRVERGLVRRSRSQTTQPGLDEKSIGRSHQ